MTDPSRSNLSISFLRNLGRLWPPFRLCWKQTVGELRNGDARAFFVSVLMLAKSDLFAVFTERMLRLVKRDGYAGLMTPFTWMFISSYEHLRRCMVETNTLLSLVQPEYHACFLNQHSDLCFCDPVKRNQEKNRPYSSHSVLRRGLAAH
jgi:hypothetical protein